MYLVRYHLKYREFIRTLRNDKRVKYGFIQQEEISRKSHAIYMDKYWANYFICINENEEPLGYIGVINNDIRICTHPDHQKKGVALFMLKEIKNFYPMATAKVKIDNILSQNLFEKAGFKPKYYIYERKEHKT